MKKFLAISLACTSICFSYSEMTYENMQKTWQFVSINDVNGSIIFLDTLINDELIANTEKVHYLILRSEMHSLNMQKELAGKDILELGVLMDQYPECRLEKSIYYPDLY